MSIKLSKEASQELAYGFVMKGFEHLEVVDSTLIDSTRWSLHYEITIKDNNTGKFYQQNYSVGATESQDEQPFEYESSEIEWEEVVPVDVTIIKYKPIKEVP